MLCQYTFRFSIPFCIQLLVHRICCKLDFISKPSTLQYTFKIYGTSLSKTAHTLRCSFCIILLSNRGNLAVSKLLISSTAFFNLFKKRKDATISSLLQQ